MAYEQDVTQYQFFHQLKELQFVEAIYLYGSRARGDNDPRSDIDIAINCPTADDNDWLKIVDIVENADTLLKIECVRYDNIQNKEFLEQIDKYKKVLYEKSEGQFEGQYI